MAKLNIPTRSTPVFTHEGTKAYKLTPEQMLRRSVCACLLWEDTFYEDGQSTTERIKSLIPLVSPEKVSMLAIEAREKFKLRHLPLFLVREMARLDTHKRLVADTLAKVVQRPDELSEFLAIYWKGEKERKKSPLSAQVKRGLALAFPKFNEYTLAKYNRDSEIKLKDVLFLCHAKPNDPAQAEVWKKLIDGKLEIPDTWEVEISKNKSNRASWERLLVERKLGGLALLRNLRNMIQADVDYPLIKAALADMKVDRILPFRFISAAKYAPQLEPQLEVAMLKCLGEMPKLSGRTALVVDGSGSMFGTPISAKSEIDRFEAAAALAILAREICEDCTVTVFSRGGVIVPPRHGFALRDAMYHVAERVGTYTQHGIEVAARQGYDRIIILTDEQSHQSITNPIPNTKAYVVNVATYQHGIGYGEWTHVDGWSEAVLNFIQELEREEEKYGND